MTKIQLPNISRDRILRMCCGSAKDMIRRIKEEFEDLSGLKKVLEESDRPSSGYVQQCIQGEFLYFFLETLHDDGHITIDKKMAKIASKFLKDNNIEVKANPGDKTLTPAPYMAEISSLTRSIDRIEDPKTRGLMFQKLLKDCIIIKDKMYETN